MIKHILFPTDFSQNAENAFAFAIDLAKKNGSKISLVHVYEVPLVPPSNIFVSRSKTMSYAEELMATAINQKMDELFEKVDMHDVPYECIIQKGDAQRVIQDIAAYNGVDIIVMGTKGETEDRELFMGSVTKNLIQNVYCPVLAIPGDYTAGNIEQIVYTTDLEDDELNVVKYMEHFSKLFGSKLTILHLDNDVPVKQKQLLEIKNYIETHENANISFQDIIVADVISGIEVYIAENEIDILAITTKTTSLIDKIFHRSLTKEVLFHTHIPILAFNRKMKDNISF